MRTIATRKRILLTVSCLILIGLFGLVGLYAGELLSTETALAPPGDLPNPPLNVAEANRDADGNIKVHEQGTVRVTGTVNVGNAPAVQDVRVVDGGSGSIKIYDETVQQLEEDIDLEFDISPFSSVRILTGVQGVGTASIILQTDAGIFEAFDQEAAHVLSTAFTDAPGTKLFIKVAASSLSTAYPLLGETGNLGAPWRAATHKTNPACPPPSPSRA